jgi:ribosome maturation protein SDO1
MVRVDDAIVARLEKFGHKFEVLVEPNLALQVKHGKSVAISDLVAADRIFKDARAGDEQSPDTLKKSFHTENFEELVYKIIREGEVQLTTEQRRALLEKRRLEVINFISRNSINPQTKAPHPPQRIENAMEQEKVHVDAFKSAEEQISDIVKAIRHVIPISMEKIDFAVKIPAQYAGRASSIIHKYEVRKEEWLSDGSLAAEFLLPSGAKQDLMNELNSATHGEIIVKILESRN